MPLNETALSPYRQSYTRMKNVFLLFFLLPFLAKAQAPDQINDPAIRSVKLYQYGNILSYPVLTLNGNELLELHFDDMDADIKNYYYSYQLCNADWSPAGLQTYDYTKGFQSNRISTYRNSSIAQTRYIHYQAMIPDRNSVPSRSGNYLLRVFLNDDTSHIVFTKRFLVVEYKTNIAAQVLQPFNGQIFTTHQRVQVGVSTASGQVNTFSPQDLKVVIVQNNIWSHALLNDRPTIFRGNYYEYSDELTTTFPAGLEWRWIDLRSLRLMSDRMRRIADSAKETHVFVRPDSERGSQLYVHYQDLNGIYTVENRDWDNPYWQSEYAHVHFSFFPPANRPYEGKSVYIYGELTNYATDENSKLIFNEERGAYEKTLLLKQGYYNYSYVSVNDRPDPGNPNAFENTEGNYWGTENGYMVLVYFRHFGARSDELIGFTRINSIHQQ